MNRVFTDEDTYEVGFDSEWSTDQRLILLGAAISIDFDFFESNASSLIEDLGEGSFLGSFLGSLLGLKGKDSSSDD